MPKAKNYDFAGWVTKHDIKCSDGVTIMHDAFKDSDGKRVPLVWNHDYNDPENVLGYMDLKHGSLGIYGYGYFNDNPKARSSKEMLKHGDLSSLSIGARKIKRNGSNVIHGDIYEVSLVLAGANPGAQIETVIQHSEGGSEESGTIWTNTIIHAADDILDIEEAPVIQHKEGESMGNPEAKADERTVGDVLETLNEEQAAAVETLLELVAEEYENKEKEGDEPVKHNVFNKEDAKANDTLKHSFDDSIKEAMAAGASSWKQVLNDKLAGDNLKHGINSIEMLFPEAYTSANGNTPIIYKDPNTAYKQILSAIHKSPFSRVKTMVADLTEAEARAKGYVKGAMKKEEFFSLIKRVTGPTTVYKKQKIDRDDITDIQDFNVVAFMQSEMRMMLEEELARAAMVSDGREVDDDDKINEANIRPIATDHEFFTIQKQYTGAANFIEVVILAMAEYRGSGNPTCYIDPALLSSIKLLKGTDNRFLFGAIPSTAAIADMLGLAAIVPTSFMSAGEAIIVNLSDYYFGATRGGEVTNFDDFDIDFNQYKYLTETRLSGALVMPKSAIHLSTAVVTGADTAAAGMTYGNRMPTTTTTTVAPTTTTTTEAPTTTTTTVG